MPEFRRKICELYHNRFLQILEIINIFKNLYFYLHKSPVNNFVDAISLSTLGIKLCDNF